MIVSITGTPGTGKTTLADGLRGRGYRALSLDDVIEPLGLLDSFDEDSESFLVDAGILENVSLEGDLVFVEGHLSHLIACDNVIVLRCHPDIIGERLRGRKYSEGKVQENVRAEALDIILMESVMAGKLTREIDVTYMGATAVLETVIGIINGKVHGLEPGSVDWSEVMMRWD